MKSIPGFVFGRGEQIPTATSSSSDMAMRNAFDGVKLHGAARRSVRVSPIATMWTFPFLSIPVRKDARAPFTAHT